MARRIKVPCVGRSVWMRRSSSFEVGANSELRKAAHCSTAVFRPGTTKRQQCWRAGACSAVTSWAAPCCIDSPRSIHDAGLVQPSYFCLGCMERLLGMPTAGLPTSCLIRLKRNACMPGGPVPRLEAGPSPCPRKANGQHTSNLAGSCCEAETLGIDHLARCGSGSTSGPPLLSAHAHPSRLRPHPVWRVGWMTGPWRGLQRLTLPCSRRQIVLDTPSLHPALPALLGAALGSPCVARPSPAPPDTLLAPFQPATSALGPSGPSAARPPRARTYAVLLPPPLPDIEAQHEVPGHCAAGEVRGGPGGADRALKPQTRAPAPLPATPAAASRCLIAVRGPHRAQAPSSPGGGRATPAPPLECPFHPAALPPPCRINSFLDSVDVGDLIVKGDLEAYSCEHPLVKRHGEPASQQRPSPAHRVAAAGCCCP